MPESRLEARWRRLFPLGALPRRRSFSHSFCPFTKTESPGANRESGWLRTDQMRQLLPGAVRFFGGLVIKVARLFCKQKESELLVYCLAVNKRRCLVPD